MQDMWFGLMHHRSEDGDPAFGSGTGAIRIRDRGVEPPEVDEHVVVVAYEPRRLFKVAAPLSELPVVLTFLRAASDGGRNLLPPRCGCCGELLEVPPVDEDVPECASA